MIINGPNLNLLGERETDIYGDRSFDDFMRELLTDYPSLEIDQYQSNVEGELIDKLQESDKLYDGIVLNAAAYTHTSVALRDAVSAIATPVVEVHISNPHARESFRHKSLIAPVCRGVISGFGLDSYKLAINSFV